LAIAGAIHYRRHKQSAEAGDDSGDHELSVFSTVTNAIGLRNSNLSSLRQSSDLSSGFVMDLTSATMTGTLSKKRGVGSSRWDNYVFSTDAKTGVFSWQASKSTKTRQGHMQVQDLFKLPTRDGKKAHRFDAVGVIVTLAQEQNFQQAIQKRRDELQRAYDGLSSELHAEALASGSFNPGVEQPTGSLSTDTSKHIALAKTQDVNGLRSTMRAYLAAEHALATAESEFDVLMRYGFTSGENMLSLSADSDASRSAWVGELTVVCKAHERPLTAHPEYKSAWAMDMLGTQIGKIERGLKVATSSKKYKECEALQTQLDLLNGKRTEANQLHEQMKLAHGSEKERIVQQLEELRIGMEESSMLDSGSVKWVHAMRQFDIPASKIEKLEVLGRGGFGTVRRGKCYGSPCVVKEIKTSTPAEEAMAAKMLQKESRALSKLQHPNVIRLLHVCTEPGSLCIVLELAEQGNLKMFLEKHPDTPVWRRFWFICGITLGMASLHRRKPPMIHHDLKPENVLITNTFMPKIGDFGTVTGTHSTKGAMSTAAGGAGAGTLAYQSPEVLNMSSGAGAATGHDERPVDVYAWGITSFETITGQSAWGGMTHEQVVANVVQRKRPAGWPNGDEQVASSENNGETAIQAMIVTAWKHDPSTRPSFEDLVDMCSHARQQDISLQPPEGASRAALSGQIFVVVSTSAYSLQNEDVMGYVEAVAKVRDDVIFGYDWEGSSTADTRDGTGSVNWSDQASVAKSLWFKGYCERIKAEVLVLAQLGQNIVLVCIKGGPITQLEAKTMKRLKKEIETDLKKKQVPCNMAVEEIGFYDFKQRFSPGQNFTNRPVIASSDAHAPT
jgi:serine/threonine protein kinase